MFNNSSYPFFSAALSAARRHKTFYFARIYNLLHIELQFVPQRKQLHVYHTNSQLMLQFDIVIIWNINKEQSHKAIFITVATCVIYIIGFKTFKHHLHRPNANFSCFQKSIFRVGIRFRTVYHVTWSSLKIKRKNLR
jgi:hypothetical protein